MYTLHLPGQSVHIIQPGAHLGFPWESCKTGEGSSSSSLTSHDTSFL